MRIAWPDLAAALGLLLVIEGMYPVPEPARRCGRRSNASPTMDDGTSARRGVASMVAGILVLWLARS